MKMSTCSVVITSCRNLHFPKIEKFKKQLHRRVNGLSLLIHILKAITNFIFKIMILPYINNIFKYVNLIKII